VPIRGLCPDAYLEGVTDGLQRLRVHAEAALGEFRRTGGEKEQPHAAGRIEQIAAEAKAAADYAAGLGDTPEVRAEVLAQVRVALERLYLLGQLLAMPHLATQPPPGPKRTSKVAPSRPLPSPGRKGFDAWCLTDPRVVKPLKRIRAANLAIDEMWAADPDPAKTLALKSEIDAALYRADIGYDSSHFYACPWSAVYVVKQPLRIGSRALEPLQTFTVDIGLEKGRFHRRIVAGSFYAAGRVAYWGRRDDD
jgi:hypothetical protein